MYIFEHKFYEIIWNGRRLMNNEHDYMIPLIISK